MRRDYKEPDDFEYEPTAHDDVLARAKEHRAAGREPAVIVEGSEGRAVLRYASDTLETDSGTTTHEREDLRENLLAHRADPAVPLYCPLAATGGFTRVVEAVRTAKDPAGIPAELIRWEGEGLERHPVVLDVERWIDRASDELALFSEIGAPWSTQSTRENS